jgi:hypothetical protein
VVDSNRRCTHHAGHFQAPACPIHLLVPDAAGASAASSPTARLTFGLTGSPVGAFVPLAGEPTTGR